MNVRLTVSGVGAIDTVAEYPRCRSRPHPTIRARSALSYDKYDLDLTYSRRLERGTIAAHQIPLHLLLFTALFRHALRRLVGRETTPQRGSSVCTPDFDDLTALGSYAPCYGRRLIGLPLTPGATTLRRLAHMYAPMPCAVG